MEHAAISNIRQKHGFKKKYINSIANIYDYITVIDQRHIISENKN